MRDIKFRGRTGSGVWKYGCLMYSDNIQPAIHWEVGKGLVKSWDWAFVIPETVGQYTGLKDKNGKEIYEGDVCKGKLETGNPEGMDEVSGEVAFEEWAFWVGGYPACLEDIEITGNIHESCQ